MQEQYQLFSTVVWYKISKQVICIANNVEYLDKEHSNSTKKSTNEITVHSYLSYLSNAIKKIAGKI